jgi:hypothetical protein
MNDSFIIALYLNELILRFIQAALLDLCPMLCRAITLLCLQSTAVGDHAMMLLRNVKNES